MNLTNVQGTRIFFNYQLKQMKVNEEKKRKERFFRYKFTCMYVGYEIFVITDIVGED